MAFKIWSTAKMCLLAAVCFAVVHTPLVRCQTAAISTGLHNQDVVELVKTGISTDVVVDQIRSSETDFDTSAASLKELKEAHIPEPIILAMEEASARKGAPAANSLSYNDFGHVKIYRQRRTVGFALINSIWVDHVLIANIANGRHCSVRLRPGRHEIRSDEKSSPITLDVQRGKEYYIRIDEVEIPSLLNYGYGKLTLVQPEQGRGEYQLQRPVEKDRRVVKEMLDADF